MNVLRSLANLAAAMVCTAVLATPATAKISVARQAELLHLLRQDCGSCHGTMTLRGGLGSPLTPAALADRPVDLLVEAVLDGRPGTPMAPWRTLVNEEEATWLVEQLRTGLPAEH